MSLGPKGQVPPRSPAVVRWLIVRINGSLIGGTNDFSGQVSAAKEIVSLKIGKDLKGGDIFDGPL